VKSLLVPTIKVKCPNSVILKNESSVRAFVSVYEISQPVLMNENLSFECLLPYFIFWSHIPVFLRQTIRSVFAIMIQIAEILAFMHLK